MSPLAGYRYFTLVLLLTAAAAVPASASETLPLLPAGTDVVLTLNIKQLRQDHRKTAFIQELFEPWRLALRGDEKKLRQFHQAHDLLKNAGLTEESFLQRARAFRALSASLGLNPFDDVDRVTFGLRKADPAAWMILVEGRFKKEQFRPTGGTPVGLVRPTVLAITGRKREMDELRARAAGTRRDTLAPALRALLEKAEKEHVAICLDQVDTLVKDLAQGALGQAAKVLGIDDNAPGKRLVDRVVAVALKSGEGIACACAGLSVDTEESRLQIGLTFRKKGQARSLAQQLNRNRVLAALAIKLIDSKLTRQLADVLLRADVGSVKESVFLRARVPHALLQEAAEELVTTLYPVLDRMSRQVMRIPLWDVPKPPPGACAVQETLDVAYREGAAADPIRHQLDLFVPRGKKGCPVVVVVHGGGWIMGDNCCGGLYSSVGKFLASQGFVAVLPNYRLAPVVKYADQVRDLARALRWTRDHISAHGGDPSQIFLLGHSAGGHLVALLATDDSFLKAEGMSLRDIKGVVACSGVYRVPPGIMTGFLGGTGIRSFRPDQLLPLRGAQTPLLPPLPPLGVALALDVFGPAFGTDPKTCRAASPVSHVRRGLPPFLFLIAENDLPTLPRMAEEMHHALQRAGCASRLVKLANRNHNSLLFTAITPEDPAARAILAFLRENRPAR